MKVQFARPVIHTEGFAHARLRELRYGGKRKWDAEIYPDADAYVPEAIIACETEAEARRWVDAINAVYAAEDTSLIDLNRSMHEALHGPGTWHFAKDEVTP